MPDIVLDVAIPPSVNSTRKIDYWGHQKLKFWFADNDKRLVYNRQHKYEALIGRYEVIIQVSEEHIRKDLDNIAKAAIDYCVSRKMVRNDNPKWLRRVVVEIADVPDQCRITLRPI
jgi:hypothetical protein